MFWLNKRQNILKNVQLLGQVYLSLANDKVNRRPLKYFHAKFLSSSQTLTSARITEKLSERK